MATPGDPLAPRPALDAGVRPVLVLGLGNVLLHDEGIGVRVVERLEREYALPEPVEVLDGGTAGLSLLDAIASRSELIVVDAARTGGSPGTVVRLRNSAIRSHFHSRMSPHQLALSDILAFLSFDGQAPENVTILGIEPEDLSTGIGLSESLEGQVALLVEMVLDELAAIGCIAEPRRPEPAPSAILAAGGSPA